MVYVDNLLEYLVFSEMPISPDELPFPNTDLLFYSDLSPLLTQRRPEESWAEYSSREKEFFEACKKRSFGNIPSFQMRLVDNCTITALGMFRVGELIFKPKDYHQKTEYETSIDLHALVYDILDGVDADISKYLVSDSDSIKSMDDSFCCAGVNEREILHLFSYEETVSSWMRNYYGFLQAKQNEDGYICFDFWVGATGAYGRSSIIERSDIGEVLSVDPFEHRLSSKKRFIRKNDGRILGNMFFEIDTIHEYASHDEYDEYNCIYEEAEALGVIKLSHAIVKRIVPHGENGRTRKAYLAVTLCYCLSKAYVFPSPESYLIRTMHTITSLAQIDYARKYRIITRRLPCAQFIEQILPHVSYVFPKVDGDVLFSGNLFFLKLDDIVLSDAELNEFWNVYSPLICSLRESSDEKAVFEAGQYRYFDGSYLVFVCYIEREQIKYGYSNAVFERDVTKLIIYRKEMRNA